MAKSFFSGFVGIYDKIRYTFRGPPGYEDCPSPVEGKKLYVLIHAINGSPRQFWPMIDELHERGIHEIWIPTWTWKNREKFKLRMMGKLTHHTNVCLVGLSFGGNIALDVAQLIPEYIAHLVTICSPLRGTKLSIWDSLKYDDEKVIIEPEGVECFSYVCPFDVLVQPPETGHLGRVYYLDDAQHNTAIKHVILP